MNWLPRLTLLYVLFIGAGCEGVLTMLCKLTRSYMYSMHTLIQLSRLYDIPYHYIQQIQVLDSID